MWAPIVSAVRVVTDFSFPSIRPVPESVRRFRDRMCIFRDSPANVRAKMYRLQFRYAIFFPYTGIVAGGESGCDKYYIGAFTHRARAVKSRIREIRVPEYRRKLSLRFDDPLNVFYQTRDKVVLIFVSFTRT